VPVRSFIDATEQEQKIQKKHPKEGRSKNSPKKNGTKHKDLCYMHHGDGSHER
jgi:hypothetical protein